MNLPISFNWVDLVAFIIISRIIYIAVKKGFVAEVFKVFATFLSLFFAFHLYMPLSRLFIRYLSFLGKDLGRLLPFIIIYSLFWLFISYLRKLVMLIFKIEPHALVERWFCLFFGLLRALVFVSIFFFMFYTLNIGYLNRSLDGSVSFYVLRNTSIKSYLVMGSVLNKLFPGFSVNKEVGKTYEAEKSI